MGSGRLARLVVISDRPDAQARDSVLLPLKYREPLAVKGECLLLLGDALGLVNHESCNRRRFRVGQLPVESPIKIAYRH